MEEKNKNRLKEILEEIGFTKKAFADEIGSTQDMISQCVNGHKQVPIKLAMKICEKFNYSLDYIYNMECKSMIDFRELLKFEDNKIHIYIPRKYAEYIIESKKYRDLSEVGKILDNNNDIECKISIKKRICLNVSEMGITIFLIVTIILSLKSMSLELVRKKNYKIIILKSFLTKGIRLIKQ